MDRSDTETREQYAARKKRENEEYKLEQARRFRVTVAAKLLASSQQWAIECQIASDDAFLRKAARHALRAADLLIEEASK